jgi:hypothetical protein
MPRKDTKWSFADAAERATYGPLGSGVSQGDLGVQEDTRQLYVWDGSTWLPTAARSIELVDHVSALADTTGLTLNGLASETDGAYLVVGRIAFGTNSIFELRPDGIAQTGIASDFNQSLDVSPSGSSFTSSTGWIVAGALSADGTAIGTSFFTAWIWPSGLRHGATSARAGNRMFRMAGTNNPGGNVFRTAAWGEWTDTAYPSWSSLLVGGFGSTIEQGSEIMLYRAKYD